MSAPEVLTYNSLKSDIAVYAERSDQEFLDQIDRFIMLGEQRLALEAKGLGFKRVVNGQFEAHNPVLEKPERWRETASLFYANSLGEVVFLRPRTYEYCRVYSSGTADAEPLYYADYDFDHIYVSATPLTDYSFELCYYERPVPLSANNQTNWTTRYAPQLLLYACLLEAQPFLKNQGLLAMWQSQYAEILSSLQLENTKYNHDNTEGAK